MGYSLYATLFKCSDVPEVLEVQVVPSDEVRMVPLSPTTTNNPLDVALLLSSLLLQEIAVRLKRYMRNMYKTFFIFVLHQ